jgi:tripartite-type tricarboxylate transporter receptor subunit TctC
LKFFWVVLTSLFACVSQAQTYPSKPIRFVVPFPPGGGTDSNSRALTQRIARNTGWTFVIDNKPGAGSNLGTETVARAEPDGYTLMADSVSNAINPTLYKKLNYDQLKDLIPVASIDVVPNVMDINIDLPVKTVPEFIAYAKSNPDKISMGSGGIGSSPHVAGELFKMTTGVNMLHIPYRGVALATADLFGGRIQVLFDTLPAAVANIRAGKIRALAVTSKKRAETLPEVPAMNEFVPGYEADSFHGISAPKGTPREIVDKLNREINAALADPKLKARLAELGAEVFTGTPEDYGRYLKGEIERWAKVIEFSGAKAE